MTRSRPRVWPVFTVLITTLLVQLLAGIVFVFGLMLVRHGATSQMVRTPPVFAATVALGVSITALVGIVAVVLSPTSWRLRLSLPSLRASPLDVLLLLAAATGIAGVSNGIAHLLGIDTHSTLQAFQDASAAASPGYLALFIALGCLAAIAEELLFRGYAQTRLASRWGPWAGITIAALFFGGVHFDLVQGTFAFLVGILLGWVAVQRRSIATGIYAHAANNAVAFSLMWLLAGSGNEPLYSPSIDILLNAALFGGALFLLRGEMGRSPVPEQAPLPAEPPAPPQPGPPAATQPARRRVFIVAGSGCLLLIAIPAILFAGLVAVRLWSPERRALRSRGSAFGALHLDRDCLDAAISGGSGIPRGASDELRRVFLNSCLQKARPSASFCAGVPAFTAFGKLRSWTHDACKARPASSRRTCGAVITALIGYCDHHPAR